MEDYDKLMVGDQSTDGRIIIADKDRLCYLVKSGSKGSFSIRTISKQLLGEFIDYYRKNIKDYAALVYFTDGECYIPENVPKDTIWVITSAGDHKKEYPGRTLLIPSKDEN